jgi:hypothetical protein
MLQQFGCKPNGESLVHDVGEVVSGLFRHYDMPCTAETAGPRAMTFLFRRAYRAHRGKKLSRAARERILADVRDYTKRGNLPDYVMRAWIARDGGDTTVARHLEAASKPLVSHVAA